MLEQIDTEQEWPRATWATQLAGLLSRKALDSYSALAQSSAKDYDAVKTAILERYDVNTELYRQRFRSETRKLSESFRNFRERLVDHLTRWEKSAEGMELGNLMLLEQFLQTLPKEMTVRVREGKPETMQEVAEAADSYELAPIAGAGGSGPPRQHQVPDTTPGRSTPPTMEWSHQPDKGRF